MMDAALGRKLKKVVMKKRRLLVDGIIVQCASELILGAKRVVAGTAPRACRERVGG